ncbi:MAG: hypothetical protein JWM12_1642 [Ilumatobacteraceae bacterium]|nr:hypothetical protein [Ilumatobacteraceae bacterium]
MSWIRRGRGVAVTVALGVGALASTGAATASASRPKEDAPAPSGWVRFGHFAPAQAPVDLYVDGNEVATNVAFKTVSSYLNVPAGTHTFSVKPASQPDAPDLLSVEAGVPADNAETIAAVTTRDGLAVQVYDDALASPPPGEALVRFIHSAPDVAAVDIAVTDGPVIAAAIPYPSATPYQAIAAGTYNVEVREAGTTNVVVKVAGWSIAAGVQSSIIIVKGLDGNLDVVPVLDAAAVSAAPVGGVQTGYGGMAPKPSSSQRWPFLAVPVLLAAAFAGWRLRRRATSATLVRTPG